MPIEATFNNIADLNPSYPTGTDYRKDGDNHIRGIKNAIKSTFPNISDTVDPSELDLNTLVGIAVDPINTLNTGGLIPSGVICMWSGLLANIPDGWYLCDGTNGTPDLSGRFIMGTVSENTGYYGSATLTTAGNGSHTHGGSTGSTVLTTDQIPAHGHAFVVNSLAQNSVQTDGSGTGGFVVSQVGSTTTKAANGDAAGSASGKQIGGSGGGSGHTHTISAAGGHTHTVDITNAIHFKMAFIMKA